MEIVKNWLHQDYVVNIVVNTFEILTSKIMLWCLLKYTMKTIFEKMMCDARWRQNNDVWQKDIINNENAKQTWQQKREIVDV